VVGVDAVEERLGGYSGPGINTVSILEGIKNKAGNNIKVSYKPGCGRTLNEYVIVPKKYLTATVDGKKVKGLKGEYFNNIEMSGTPALTRVDPQINFRWTLFSPDKDKINYDFFSVRWTGKLKAPQTGNFKIGIEGNDGYRLYIDGKLVIDNWQKQTYRTITKEYWFERGKKYDIRIEFYETIGHVWFKLLWTVGAKNDSRRKIREAVNLARKSDIVIVAAGIDEGESLDRAYLNLPGHQEEMIKQIAATGKPVVVVLVGGSAITMNKWIDDVDGIVDMWYGGDEGGNAIADVLFGDYNPAGRLPITFPIFEGQLPLYYNHKPTGRVDDYINLTGKPLFPFGYGLSYTTFEYSDLKFSSQKFPKTDSITVTFKVTNTGDTAGDEVVQLYIKDLLSSVVRPVMELKGFKRIHLAKGETENLSFTITPEMLSMLDINLKRIVEPGDFRIMIGASSNDIRLRGIVTVTE
jgi:beta-glucosidase